MDLLLAIVLFMARIEIADWPDWVELGCGLARSLHQGTELG